MYVVTGAELTLRHHNFYKSCLGSNHHLLDAALTCPMAQFVVYVHQETMSQIDAKRLYNNLKALLKHFSQSPKSSEMLYEALNMLEMNDIHLLNWGSTLMVGFLDAYIRASNIIVPFFYKVISRSIRPDETKFLTSPLSFS